MLRYAQTLGARFFGMLQIGGQIVFLFQDILRCLVRYPIRFRLLVRQIDFIGAKSVPVVIITGGFIGAVFAAQCEFQFRALGMSSAVGPVVAIAMCRELDMLEAADKGAAPKTDADAAPPAGAAANATEANAQMPVAAQMVRGSYPVKREIVASIFYIPKVSSKTPPIPPPSPFYAALPFNDLAHPETAKTWVPSKWTKATAAEGKPRSACVDRWLKITNQAGISCYAQWEDFGPGLDDDAECVFGDKQPKSDRGFGIDLSPGTAAFLGINNKIRTVSWQFVDERDVPSGPWLPASGSSVRNGKAEGGSWRQGRF